MPSFWSLPEGKWPVATLLIIVTSVVVTAMASFFPSATYHAFYSSGWEIWWERKWPGLLGSAFVHGGPTHLIFNCYWLWIFGRVLEIRLGTARFLALFLATSWASAIAELSWSGNPGIGLSGVVYAFFGFLLIGRSRDPKLGTALSKDIVILFLVWLVVCFALTYTKVWLIGNAAHVAGLLVGIVIGFAWLRPADLRAKLALVVVALISFVPLFWAPWQELWLAKAAYDALTAHNTERAWPLLESVLAKNPKNSWALKYKIQILLPQHKYKDEVDSLAAALNLEPDNLEYLNQLAWVRATCPDAQVRNGVQAVAYASRLCEIDQWKNAAYLDTLAAAHAEAGDFEEAIKWETKALTVAVNSRSEIQRHLELFRNRQPIREA